MARFIPTLVMVCIAAFAGQRIHAAPINMTEPAVTKVDSLQCNVARATIITDLNEFGVLLQKIDTSNDTVASAVSDAQGGLKTTGDAITSILQALIAGEAPPAEGRDKTSEGLGVMLQALTGLNSTEPAVSDALSKLNDAIAAGNEVVAVCK
ncbi:hypothetical protein Moror_3303 [Moniliophthora roreri MCA 2997]|uniref:Uncharacterized protein n=2 Tax=Moniliophthora roreri TaxID=221103 RepID=V2WSM5_MONRO|nr:hypothetical protein Moror_3303 [Moniliophthora roreri MCA 2997]KAI3597560.1 hypothetical protein WG66_003169 [Moniliophthora roreri]